jgi:hypothetical protein
MDVVTHDDRERIYFYSPCFVDFLVQRLVLIPCLKEALVQRGGFLLIASSFSHQDRTFVLFGYPGSGKTRLTLAALNAGARLVGDNGLAILGRGSVHSVYDEIELRYRTVRGTPFWPLLTSEDQLKLACFHLVSFLSRRYLSFNISVPLADLGIEVQPSLGQERLIFVQLGNTRGRLTSSETIDAIAQYEQWYQERFGETYHHDTYTRDLRDNIGAFLSRCSMWRLPADCGISDILRLE